MAPRPAREIHGRHERCAQLRAEKEKDENRGPDDFHQLNSVFISMTMQ